jgi:hypothetical protein
MQNAVFNIQNQSDFKTCALQVFRHQFKNNAVYRSFCDLLYIHSSDVKEVEEIPFLNLMPYFQAPKQLKKLLPVLEPQEAVLASIW